MAEELNGSLGSGETVLVSTRQHWVAAIRYAARPIVLALAAVGLWLLNGVLDIPDGNFLSFINDIVRGIVIIMAIVSLVWLPVLLAQWYSRRYILTSRRAIRSYGILRKHSLDTSLEQINDIGLTQSFLGRKLGYADLELFTASSAANETYAQLIDGPKFKAVVLEAKDAIRGGTPMTALPDGFVITGGTNEASTRAAEKPTTAETAAAGAATAVAAEPVSTESPATDPGVAPAPATAVMEAESEPAPEPMVEVAPEPEPAPVVGLESLVEPELAPMVEPEPVVEVAPEPEPAPVVEPEPVVEQESVVEPDIEPVIEADAVRVIESEEAPAVEPEAETPPPPAPKSKSKSSGPTTL